MSNILVTGGLGTIGAGLITELRNRGHHVISCDLPHQPDEIGFSLRTDVEVPLYARCDVGEFRQIERVLERCGPFDYVYHCAAEFGRWNGEDFYETLWRTNAIGTKNVIRLQERLKFRLIHFSSSEVYGDWPDLMVETVMDEYEIKQLNDYAMSKWVNEMQVRNSALQYGTETVVVRLFNTYGPGEYYSPYRSVNCRFLYCALHGLPWTVFRGHSRTSTYLADTVRTIANITNNFRAGETYNIGGGAERANIDLVKTICGLLDKVAPRKSGKYADLISFVKDRPGHDRRYAIDASKIARELGWRPREDFDSGLANTVRWYVDNRAKALAA